jgi:hypothetical protein
MWVSKEKNPCRRVRHRFFSVLFGKQRPRLGLLGRWQTCRKPQRAMRSPIGLSVQGFRAADNIQDFVADGLLALFVVAQG